MCRRRFYVCHSKGHSIKNLTENLLTFRWGTQYPSFVAMVTVVGYKLPAPALQERAFVATAAKAGVVEEARTRTKVGVLKSSAYLAADIRT